MEDNLFDSAKPFYLSADEYSTASERLLKESGRKLGLGLDPFHLEIKTHRQLQNLNENAYSDWLAWTLQVVCNHTERPIAFCKSLFSPGIRDIEYSDEFNGEIPLIQRELHVTEGHEGHTGRLDLLIHFAKARLTWHIEVKKGSAEEADLTKNIGYANALSARKQYAGCRNLLLVTQHDKNAYDSFTPLKWKEICERIRQWIISNGHGGFQDAILLFFCAIVEQQLLNLTVGSLRQIDYISDQMGG